MNPFEKFLSRQPEKSEGLPTHAEELAHRQEIGMAEYEAASARAAAAERTTSYKVARSTELISLIVEQDRLKRATDTARASLRRAQGILDLTSKIHERRPHDPAFARDMANAEADLHARQDALTAAEAELARATEELERKDAELRSRFGLTDQD